MKAYIFNIIFLLTSVISSSQCDYSYVKYVGRANTELDKETGTNFELVINSYMTAMILCPDSIILVRNKFREVLEINELKKEKYSSTAKVDESYKRNTRTPSSVIDLINIDDDGDGIMDEFDLCPKRYGFAEYGGCPSDPTDIDEDGIMDDIDECPDLYGILNSSGCPDSDGDGVTDNLDLCPDSPGSIINNGCPKEDYDGDGVVDIEDKELPKMYSPPREEDSDINGETVVRYPNEEIIDKMYFYNYRFGAFFNGTFWGYIDNDGNTTIPFIYSKAENFIHSKFTKVENEKGKFILDTLATEYILAERIKESNGDTEALSLSEQDISISDLEKIKNPEKLIYLDLSKCNLDSFPEILSKFKNLVYLNLSGNYITELPQYINKLNKLEYLILSGNELGLLPKEIGELQQLTTLDLSLNQLIYLPGEINKLPILENLYLNYNKLTDVPNIDSLTQLKNLDLSDNHIRELPSNINRNLNYLYLRETPISEDYKKIDTLQKQLPNTDIAY